MKPATDDADCADAGLDLVEQQDADDAQARRHAVQRATIKFRICVSSVFICG
jgi:hypothetical protein